MWELDCKKAERWRINAFDCDVEDSWESLGLQGDPTNQFWRKSVLDIHWKDWCWSWNSNTLATLWEKLTHCKRLWCWERLKAEGDDRGWDGWMASWTWWTWVWASSRSWWWTWKPGVLQSMRSQRVGHNWVTELNWIIQIVETSTNNSHFYWAWNRDRQQTQRPRGKCVAAVSGREAEHWDLKALSLQLWGSSMHLMSSCNGKKTQGDFSGVKKHQQPW